MVKWDRGLTIRVPKLIPSDVRAGRDLERKGPRPILFFRGRNWNPQTKALPFQGAIPSFWFGLALGCEAGYHPSHVARSLAYPIPFAQACLHFLVSLSLFEFGILSFWVLRAVSEDVAKLCKYLTVSTSFLQQSSQGWATCGWQAFTSL